MPVVNSYDITVGFSVPTQSGFSKAYTAWGNQTLKEIFDDVASSYLSSDITKEIIIKYEITSESINLTQPVMMKIDNEEFYTIGNVSNGIFSGNIFCLSVSSGGLKRFYDVNFNNSLSKFISDNNLDYNSNGLSLSLNYYTDLSNISVPIDYKIFYTEPLKVVDSNGLSRIWSKIKTLVGKYLPLTGGTLTGNLNMSGYGISSIRTIFINNANGYVGFWTNQKDSDGNAKPYIYFSGGENSSGTVSPYIYVGTRKITQTTYPIEHPILLKGVDEPEEDNDVANKYYVDYNIPKTYYIEKIGFDGEVEIPIEKNGICFYSFYYQNASTGMTSSVSGFRQIILGSTKTESLVDLLSTHFEATLKISNDIINITVIPDAGISVNAHFAFLETNFA